MGLAQPIPTPTCLTLWNSTLQLYFMLTHTGAFMLSILAMGNGHENLP